MMEKGTMNSIRQKPRGFQQTDDCEFHLWTMFVTPDFFEYFKGNGFEYQLGDQCGTLEIIVQTYAIHTLQYIM
jgi:hypothetical protein